MKLPEARSSGLFLAPLLPMGGPIIGKLTDVAMRNWIKTDKWFEGCSRRDACLSATVNGMAYPVASAKKVVLRVCCMTWKFTISERNQLRQLMLHCAVFNRLNADSFPVTYRMSVP